MIISKAVPSVARLYSIWRAVISRQIPGIKAESVASQLHDFKREPHIVNVRPAELCSRSRATQRMAGRHVNL